MDENLAKVIDESENINSGTNNASADTNSIEDAKKAARRKMRNWLGVKSAFSTGSHGEDYQPVSYGDGHSGWNR